jgi:mannose-binding lectin 1
VHKLKEGEEIVHDHGPSYKPDWHNYDDESEQWKHDAQDVLREHAVRLNHGESRTQGNTPVPSHDHSTTKDSHREGNKEWHWTSGSEHIADAEASQYTSESERFKDLHDRVTLLNHQADLLYNDLTLWRKQLEKYREEVMGQLHTVDGDIDSSRHMIEGIERDVQAVKNDVQALKSGLGSQDLKEFLQQLPRNEDLKELLRQLHWALSDNHLSLRDGRSRAFMMTARELTRDTAIVGNSPRLNLFAFLIVASNVLMLASYVVYVKRREGQPKKYL